MGRALRRRDAQTRWRLHYGPSMTPMVDVVLVILVFFMASATVAGPEWFLGAAIPDWAPAAGPAAGGAPEPRAEARTAILPEARFEIRLDADGGVTRVTGLGLRDAPLDALAPAAAALGASIDARDAIIVIVAGAQVPYADVVAAHDAFLGAGLERVAIIGR